MTDAPTPGDDKHTSSDPRESDRGLFDAQPDSLTARISAAQREERRRRKLRTGAIWIAIGIAVIGLGVIVAFVAFDSSSDDTGNDGASNGPGRTSTTGVKAPVTTESSTPTSNTTSGVTTSTASKPTFAPRIGCDTAAITAALLDAPEPYEINGTPNCSEAFWAVPAVVPSDNEKLTVVFKIGPDGPEPIAVKRRAECPSVTADDPPFDPGLCPA